MAHELVCVENVDDVMSKLEEAFYDIPFENSEFQTRVFVLAAQQTPGRAYRALGLRMFSKLQSVKEYVYNSKKTEIDIMEKQDLINNPTTSKYDRMRAELDLARIEDARSFSEKLVNDAIHELNVLWREFQKFPKYTREQFEAEERGHFELRLKRQMEHGGASESLENMRTDAYAIEQSIQEAKKALSRPEPIPNPFRLGM